MKKNQKAKSAIKEPVPTTAAVEKEPAVTVPIKVTRVYSRRMIMLLISGASIIVGLVMFVIYFNTNNVTVGAPSILMIGGGGFVFKYYWGKTDDDATIKHLGVVNKEQVNSMCLYPKKNGKPKEIVFENLNSPEGYPWQCLNDKKYYYVNIWDKASSALIPFVLPDQQYFDPGVFAERVLGLPAHQKIFMRKPTLFQKIKTGLLVVAIGIVWLLILTTTGG